MCLYTAAHLWRHILAMFLSRSGSRNAFDQSRQSGQAAWNPGELCGQQADDPPFQGEPTVTSSDNAARHADRVDSAAVAHLLVLMFRDLLDRRFFDHARLFDRWYLMVVDGTLKEKCRARFGEGGKGSTDGARYRYVLQLSVVGPQETLLPLMHEEMDVLLSPARVATLVNRVGRERHLIEDSFKTQKNRGIGLEHVFCARATGSKNYYTMMQVAQVLWLLTCRGGLRRLYDWACWATEQALARAVWEGLRAVRLPPGLPPLGQIRFSSA